MIAEEVQFEQACRDAVGQLRVALIQLYEGAGLDPQAPQDVARELGLNKTLTWNIARLLQAPDAMSAIAHVPGASSIEKLIESMSVRGATAASLARARDAVRAFEGMIAAHVGDRGTLDLVVDGMVGTDTDSLELSRKLAFRGESGIFGVQAKTRFSCYLAAPNRERPDLLDFGVVMGLVGFRRLRSSVSWPIFKMRHWGMDRGEILVENVDASAGIPGYRPIGGISVLARGATPDVEVITTPDGSTDFVLRPGSVGNVGAFDCVRSELNPLSAPRYRTPKDTTGEFGSYMSTPVETFVFDMIVHRDLAYMLNCETHVFARVFSRGMEALSPTDVTALPIRQRLIELAGMPPAVATPIIPRYSDMLGAMYEKMGVKPAEMRGVRLEMKYPPLGSTIIMRFELPEQA